MRLISIAQAPGVEAMAITLSHASYTLIYLSIYLPIYLSIYLRLAPLGEGIPTPHASLSCLYKWACLTPAPRASLSRLCKWARLPKSTIAMSTPLIIHGYNHSESGNTRRETPNRLTLFRVPFLSGTNTSLQLGANTVEGTKFLQCSPWGGSYAEA